MTSSAHTSAQDLRTALAVCDIHADPAGALDTLILAGLDRLPLPGQGATLQRWRALAAVAEQDLSLAKLYEGHTDALAIMAELGASELAPPGTRWGVWAAEAPQGRTVIERIDGDEVLLSGAKCWCSGAARGTHALLTAWHADGRGPQLVALALQQPGVVVSAQHWRAVGMAESASLDVTLHGARALPLGAPGAYLARPGFWHGGAGIAACWYGGSVALALVLRDTLTAAPADRRSPFALAALGRVDAALRGTAALLTESARAVDESPRDDARSIALRVRASAEASAALVLAEAGEALGATPYCRDAHFARIAADLPVFVRQSHGPRDLAALGARVVDGPDAKDNGWIL